MGKDRPANVEDTWFWLRICCSRRSGSTAFIYRDLNDLLSKNASSRRTSRPSRRTLQKNTERLMNEMRSINRLKATDGEIRAVATTSSCSPPTGTRIRT